MGFMTPNLPAVDHEAFVRLPLRDRLQILVLKWVDYGYGVPRMIHVLYIAKLVVFYAIAGIAIATATSGLPRSGMCRSGGISRSSTRRRFCGRFSWRPSASRDRGDRWRARPSR